MRVWWLWWFSGHVVYALSKLRRTRSTRSSHRHQPHQLRCPVRRSGNLEQKWSQFVSHVSPEFYLIPRYPKGRTARSGETKWILLAAILLWHPEIQWSIIPHCTCYYGPYLFSGTPKDHISSQIYPIISNYIRPLLNPLTISFLNLTVSTYFNQNDL